MKQSGSWPQSFRAAIGFDVVDDAAWQELSQASAHQPPDELRAAASRWTRAAQLEHASIASFSRFSLELLGLGAPPALVEAAHRAAIDEVHHARVSFRIASALAGRPLGPGPLSLQGIAFERPLETVVLSTVLEGCIVETVAAALANRAAALASFEAIRSSLSSIARDELTHAQLAFSFTGWALKLHGARLGDVLRPPVMARLAALRAPVASTDQPDLGRFGLLSAAEEHAVQLETLTNAVIPALSESLGRLD